MKARMLNPVRAMVAMMVMTVSAATLANAAATDRSQPSAPRDPRVNARVVAKYNQSSWLMAQAVVLDSEAAWDEWSNGEVSNGRAIGHEKAPNGVAWGREVLLVVALGENLNQSMTVTLTSARRNGSATEVTLEMSTPALAGGSSPSVVVALPKSAAHDVRLLTNLMLPELPAKATYVMASSGDPVQPAMAVTWGSLKADYR
jgi:hypothetical protein